MEVDIMTRRALPSLLLFFSNMGFLAFGQTQTAAPAQAKPVTGYAILFEGFGGYAGGRDRIWIYPDGRVKNEGGKAKNIAPQSVLAFRQRIELLLPAKTKKVPMWQKYCSDCYHYRITILSDSGVRSIVLSEPLPTKSDPLAQLTQELRDLLFDSRY